MRLFVLVLMMCLCTLLTAGQTSSPQAPPATTPSPAAAQGEKPGKPAAPAKPPSARQQAEEAREVAPDAAVITIKGLCPAPARKAASKTAHAAAPAKPATCQTVITKKELEMVIETVRPNLQPGQRRMLAQQYVELLVVANAAAKAGIEKEPKVKEQLRLQKLQILATAYSKELQQKEAEVPEADIEKYYKENAAKYEQAKLLRIYVPMVTEEGKPPDTAASKALAEKIQQRAAAGEDFDKLQKEAFSAASNKGTAPPVELGERRRGTLPPKQEEAVFGLKPGEVSAALDEASGYYIYKLVSKDAVPLDTVHDEIKGTLGREHLRESMEKVRNSAEPTFNPAYFGSAAPPETGGEVHPRPGGAWSGPRLPAPATAPPQPATPAQPATPPGTSEAPKPPPPAPPPSK
ncbi:MAG: peptidylprolyl isomerase [Terriglobales bacterium]